jgi:hypothetical protein
MFKIQRLILPGVAGMLGSLLLTGLYFGIVTLAESSKHAAEIFWQNRAILLPMVLGFGVQVALYVVLKKRSFLPAAKTGASGALTGASGTTSTLAMVACCAHHVVDVLPILGLSAAAAFLAEYQNQFMLVGLGTTIFGIVIMLTILIFERQKSVNALRFETVMEVE